MWAARDFPNFLGTPIISVTGKATEIKFGRYMHRVHLNKSPLKILENREGLSTDCKNSGCRILTLTLFVTLLYGVSIFTLASPTFCFPGTLTVIALRAFVWTL